MSLFALPVSRSARLARILVVLALDLILAGAGVAMIAAYVDERQRAHDAALTSPQSAVEGTIENSR